MKATDGRDMLVLGAGGATIAGMIAGAPLVAAIGSAIAAVAVATGRARPVRLAAVPDGRSSLRHLVETPVRRASSGFGSDAGRRNGVSPSSTDDDDTSPADREADGQAIEDLAASLESGDDEISFLPPYASGDAPSNKREDGLAILWEPAPDNALMRLLNDVLEPSGNVPMPRRFALGTVAILRNLLQPADVERILAEQRRYPRLRFGDVAVQLGFLSESELQELLAAQEEGVFTDEEILDTRRRLNAYYVEAERRESA
jgi:hypothetical protein